MIGDHEKVLWSNNEPNKDPKRTKSSPLRVVH